LRELQGYIVTMGRSKRGNNNNGRKSKVREKTLAHEYPGVVGPDIFLLLQGHLFGERNHDNESGNGNGKSGNKSGKNISLILCGESHNDAIDVTRRSPPGKFVPTAGWTPVADSLSSNDNNNNNDNDNDNNNIHSALPSVVFVSHQNQDDPHQTWQTTTAAATTTTLSRRPQLENMCIRFLHQVKGRKSRSLTLEKAKELAKNFVENHEIEAGMFGHNLILLWIAKTTTSENNSNHYHHRANVEKGEAFLLEIETEEVMDYNNSAYNYNYNNSDNDSDDDEEEDFDDWVIFPSSAIEEESSTQQRNRLELPDLVSQWMDDVMMVTNRESNGNDDDDDSTAATVDDTKDNIDDVDDDNADVDDNAEVRRNINNANASSTRMNTCRYALFEYGDLDLVAHEFSKRRLGMTDTEVTEIEHDHVVQSRKHMLKEEHNVWTFDDWFEHVRSGSAEAEGVYEGKGNGQQRNDNSNDYAVHLVLEASVPPWEFEIHRPSINNDGDVSGNDLENAAEHFRLHPAAESVRCLSEDSEASSEDEIDPTSDGIGSFIDFVYRRMMEVAMTTKQKRLAAEALGEKKRKEGIDCDENNTDENNADDIQFANCIEHNTDFDWFHCIDARDLGCEAACHAESLKEHWYKLLSQEERKILSNPEDIQKDACPVDEKGSAMRFLPAYKLNPEWIELERLRSEGLLVRDEQEDEDDNNENELDGHGNSLEFTFPSFELFFGNNTDNLYYTPHVKMAYSPFLAHCVQSLDNWEAFFTDLFFGGTIPDALNRLNLRETKSRGHVHVRSPFLQQWNVESNSYEWKERDEEDYITCPYFPFAFHLVAKGSSPPRTWSSQLFDNLHEFRDREGHQQANRRKVALLIKSFVLDSIRRHMRDPKSSDDQECGGEWFVGFLRAVHREIYDDIDISNPAILLQKNRMKSLSGNRFAKHNIGKIKIPSAKDAFDEIVARFREQDNIPPTVNVVTPRVEVLGKILIDIWMSNLFDFSLLLKIVNVCSAETKDNVVVVCYVGSAHVKVVRNFFCGSLGFKTKAMVGKFTWDDNEAITLGLPSKLWNLSELFR